MTSPAVQVTANDVNHMGRGTEYRGRQLGYGLEAPQNVNPDNPSVELKVDNTKKNSVDQKLGLTHQKPTTSLTNTRGMSARGRMDPRGVGQGRYQTLMEKHSPKAAAHLRQGQAPGASKPAAQPAPVQQKQTIALGQDSPIVKQQLQQQAKVSGNVPRATARRLGMGAGMLRSMAVGLVAGPGVGIALAAVDAARVAHQASPTATPKAKPDMMALQQQRMAIMKRNRQFAMA